MMGHFGVAKTLDTLHEHFFWPNMHEFVHNLCDKCITCRKALRQSLVKEAHEGGLIGYA